MSTTKPAAPKAPATEADFAAAALLLCVHGGGSGGAELHATRLRDRGLFRRVACCSLNGEPGLADALAGIEAETVYLAPLLMAEGYTYNEVLPRRLSQASEPAGRVVRCRALGTSPDLAPIAAAQAIELCAGRGWRAEATGVIVAAHGTRRHYGSAASARRLAARLAAMRRFHRTRAAYLEQAPDLEAALAAARPGPCIVLGFFVDDGGHASRDVPRAIAAAHPNAAYNGAIGARPEISEVILGLVRAAADEK